MANLYDKAGLVNIPVGYQDGFLYNIKPTDNTLGFRFNRDSAATRVNKEGLIEQVGYFGPELVQNGNFSEIGPELVTNGDFATDSDWDKLSGATISNGQANLIFNGLGNPAIKQNMSISVGKTYKFVFYVTEWISGNLEVFVSSDTRSGFTTINGVGQYEIILKINTVSDVRFVGSGTTSNLSIDNVSVKQVDPNDYWTLGTGWSFGDGVANYTDTVNNQIAQSINLNSGTYKLKFSISNATGVGARIWIGNTAGAVSYTDNTYQNYTNGDYTINIVVPSNQTSFAFWGNVGGSSFSITNISVTEILGDKPRIDYTDSLTSPSFLLEPQRTNLIPYSEDFSQWSKVNGAVVTDNFTTSPDGTQNAAKVVYDGTSLGRIEISTGVGGTKTQSIYLKTVSGTQVVSIGASTSDLTEVTVTSEWKRFTHTGLGSYPRVLCNDAATIYAWGAQLEQGSYATSYIPTAGSTATRAQETCTGAGNASTFNDTEGVLYAEISGFKDDPSNRYLSIHDGTNQNAVYIAIGGNDFLYVGVRSNNTTQYGRFYPRASGFICENSNKIAVHYKQNDFFVYLNGDKILEETSGSTPIGMDELAFNYGGSSGFYGKVKTLAIFNEALTDDELQQLTGPEYNSFAALAAAYNYTVI